MKLQFLPMSFHVLRTFLFQNFLSNLIFSTFIQVYFLLNNFNVFSTQNLNSYIHQYKLQIKHFTSIIFLKPLVLQALSFSSKDHTYFDTLHLHLYLLCLEILLLHYLVVVIGVSTLCPM